LNSKIQKDLEKTFGKKSSSDPATLCAYSTDASIYGIMPSAVIFIETEEDIKKAIHVARRHGIPITPRGAGTSTCGQSIGKGLILDMSRYSKMISIDKKNRFVTVEPGIVYADLNKKLAKNGLLFAPNPSSGDVCQIGANIANNSSGSNGLKYGVTRDYVEELEVYLPDGSKLIAKRYSIDSKEYKTLLAEYPSVGELVQLIKDNKMLIQNSALKTLKASCGYDLFDIEAGMAKGYLDLHHLFIGNEGTLGIVSKAKLRVIHAKKESYVALAFYKDIDDAVKAVRLLRRLSPSGLEIMDTLAIDIIRAAYPEFDIPKCGAMLLVEVDEDIKNQLEKATEILKRYKPISVAKATNEEDKEKLWKARRSLASLLNTFYMNKTLNPDGSNKKPIPIIEDIVVPPDKIKDAIAFAHKLFKKEGVEGAIFGHAGEGNLHMRLLLDMSDKKTVSSFWRIGELMFSKVKSLGGALSGEHGIGRVRGPFLKGFFGDKYHRLLAKTKAIIDPEDIMNPDVMISDKKAYEDTFFDKYSYACSTCGKCRGFCSIYGTTLDESYSPRGKSLAMHGVDDKQKSKVYQDTIDKCLVCGRCLFECPSRAAVGKEVAASRKKNISLKFIFSVMKNKSLFESMATAAGWTHPIWNNPITRRIIGMDAMPKLAKKPLRSRVKNSIKRQDARVSVAYFYGCATDIIDDETAPAMVRLLNENGVYVELPEQWCCGVPMRCYGDTKTAETLGHKNVDSLAKYDIIITSCGTCGNGLKAYPDFFKDDIYKIKARSMSPKIMDVTEFLVQHLKIRMPKKIPKRRLKVGYHDPCHMLAQKITKAPRELLHAFERSGFLEYVEVDGADRCCGGGGSYAITQKKSSKEIFDKNKREGIIQSGVDVIVTTCPSCIMQLKNCLSKEKVKVCHIIEFLADFY